MGKKGRKKKRSKRGRSEKETTDGGGTTLTKVFCSVTCCSDCSTFRSFGPG